jgi:hypothetical protein
MSEKQSQEPNGKIDLSRLAESGASAKKSAHVPEKPETAKEISFEKIGGERVLRGPAFRGGEDASAAPTESTEDEGDASE